MNGLKLLFYMLLAFAAGMAAVALFQSDRTEKAVPDAEPVAKEAVTVRPDNDTVRDDTLAIDGFAPDEAAFAVLPPASADKLRRLANDLISLGYSQGETERIIVNVAIGEWMKEVQELASQTDDEFWRRNPFDQNLDLLTEMAERRRAYEAAVAATLGLDSVPLPSLFTLTGRIVAPGITAEKRRKVMLIEEDYDLLHRRLYLHGVLLPQDVAAIEILGKEKREDLLSILTPDQLRDYELRNSSTSQQLRVQLRAFQPTEEEFRQLFDLFRELDLEYGSQFIWTPEETRRQREQAEEALMHTVRDLLGEERYADFERSQNFEYSALFTLADRLGLSHEKVDELFDLSRLIQNQQRDLRTNTTLTDQDRQDALHALFEETQTTLLEALGEDGLEVYRRHGGAWFGQLETESRAGRN